MSGMSGMSGMSATSVTSATSATSVTSGRVIGVCLVACVLACGRTAPPPGPSSLRGGDGAHRASPPDAARAPEAAPTDAPVGAAVDAPVGAPAGAPALPARWPALAASAPRIERTVDGLPILRVDARDAGREGAVRWIPSTGNTLEYPTFEATDGERVYFAAREDGGRWTDVLVRDGQVTENVLWGLSGLPAHRGGCAAAAGGELLLSTVVPVDGGRRTPQVVWRVGRDGAVSRLETPPSIASSDRCRAWLEPDGRFALALFGVVTWDGAGFAEDRGWFAGRTVMGRVGGPRYCFASCNAGETATTDPATAPLAAALACGGNADWIAGGEWVAGHCRRTGRAVRRREGDAPETLAAPVKGRAEYGTPLAMTPRGDLVIGLDYGFRSYVVWPAGAARASAVRTLDKGDVLARSSPTVLVKGAPSLVPDARVAAVTLGTDVGFGANGPTVVYDPERRGLEAREARVARARAVLPAPRLLVAHEAVLEPGCGTYVRSPLGWEGEHISDWVPPKLPPLHPQAVTRSAACTPLAEAAAFPGDPDLLLARTPSGELVAAWLPPPLPLPTGAHHFGPPSPKGPPPVQRPRPGTGWTVIGRADALAGIPAVAEPGDGAPQSPGGWDRAGGMVLGAAGAEILLTRFGAVTLPPGTRPMALDPYALHAWGALPGGRLVVCAGACRIVDPGVRAEIVAVVPRTADEVILGYADGRVGVYAVPAQGGDAVPEAPLVAALEAWLARKPAP